MNSERLHLLHSPTRESFNSLSKEAKVAEISNDNLSIISIGPVEQDMVSYIEQARQMGFSPLMLDDVFMYLTYVLNRQNVVLPEGNKNKKLKGKLVRTLLSNIEFQADPETCHVHATLREDDELINLDSILESEDIIESLQTTKRSLETDSMVFGQVLGRLKDLTEDTYGLVVTEKSPNQFVAGATCIGLSSSEQDLGHISRIDKQITATDPEIVRFGILRECVQQSSYRTRRRELEEAMVSREITLIPKFSLDNWPKDPLMRLLRRQVSKSVSSFMEERMLLSDPQDLKYQTLFRLTTFNVADVFEGGELLEAYLRSNGAYSNWRNILRTSSEYVNQFKINSTLLREVMEEQALIIEDRLKKSSLPLEELLIPSGIFAEAGWVIQKRDGEVFAVIEEDFTAIDQQIPLEFREIDPDEAIRFHNDLHYIHTPRADVAYALYMSGDQTPFSVLALDRIDRPYKQNVLLAQGYDPRKCFDLTRLYSKPGTPGNTSSSMFSLAFKHLRDHYPQTQAIFSAFMPSYATGVSMTSGGFDNPVLLKPLSHAFAKREIDGKVVYEHVTKRRQGNLDTEFIRSKFPLLPTIELMTSIQQPRYEPLSYTNEYMIEIH